MCANLWDKAFIYMFNVIAQTWFTFDKLIWLNYCLRSHTSLFKHVSEWINLMDILWKIWLIGSNVQTVCFINRWEGFYVSCTLDLHYIFFFSDLQFTLIIQDNSLNFLNVANRKLLRFMNSHNYLRYFMLV